MAVYPDNNEGEKIFNRLMETKYDFLEEELIKLIENSENVIFGKTNTIDI